MKTVIESESSFRLDKLETFEVDWDMRNECEILRSEVRAVMEPLFASHFGSTFIDKIFERFAVHLIEYISREKTKDFTITLSLTRK